MLNSLGKCFEVREGVAKMLWLPMMFLAIHLGLCRASSKSCVCWEGYKADFGTNGPQCVGLNQFHIMPCNMTKSPKCQCSGKVSSILKDRTGTWCTRYRRGEELMRWPCENGQEWDDFFKKHPDFT